MGEFCMRYAKIRKLDVTNGPGIRTTLFVSGCTHNCEGCFNKEQQDFNYGNEFTKETENEFIEYTKSRQIKGVNILGGEPMQQTKDDSLLNLLKRIKIETNKPIWLWSGYKFEEIIIEPKMLELLKQVDVLIDGKFEIEKRDLMLKYRGSENQRVIDVKKSLEQDRVIELSI
jgi:anaerobic ribonucleoside-triphosphate reductase activating protein